MLYELELKLNQEVMIEGQNSAAFSQPCAHSEQLLCYDVTVRQLSEHEHFFVFDSKQSQNLSLSPNL
jgi:hypothetical protein